MSALLDIIDIDTAYGESQVLSQVRLQIQTGSAHALLGRNGMGKTTLVRSIMGLTPPRRGEIRFLGQRIDGLSTSEIARLGIAVVPEGRQIFPNLSVRENLTAFAATRSGGATVMVGSPPAGRPIELDPALLFASRRLMGTQGGDAAPHRDLPMLADQYRRGRLDLNGLITERLPLDQINDAITHTKQGTVARSVIVF